VVRGSEGDGVTTNEMTDGDLRQCLINVVAQRMAGSPEAAQHTHVECHCNTRGHRTDKFEEGCYCPECAVKEAVARGLDERDTEPEADGPDDSPQWCDRCDRLITTEITAVGARDELNHWESGEPGTRLDSQAKWREFMLCVQAIHDEHLPRVDRLVRLTEHA
jgi:hypothetical protein